MVATAASIVLGTPAAQFRLSATNGNTYTLQGIAGSKGTVIIFICNHCPYVKAVIDRVVQDEDQSVARAYGAMCTPDFFGYDAEQKLRYHGRLDEGRTTPPPANARRELVEAMRAIAQGKAIGDQMPSVGCSIKCQAA